MGRISGPIIHADGIDRIQWNRIDHHAYIRNYLYALKPVIVQGAIDHWPALGKWTPEFFRDHHGSLDVRIDEKAWKLGKLIDRIMLSSPENPAPYLRNQLMANWPPELSADISPMPDCTRPNFLESRLFPSRVPKTYIEAYIGGAGAKFPFLHYDGLHTHAFLMQLYGKKEYLVFAPNQYCFLYPCSGNDINLSNFPDAANVDLEKFPLYAQAEGQRFELNPGEVLFVPSGWWHTARILSTSITVSINGANAGNWTAFRRDMTTSRKTRLRAASMSAYLLLLGAVLSRFGD